MLARPIVSFLYILACRYPTLLFHVIFMTHFDFEINALIYTFCREQSVSSDVSDERHPLIAHKRGQKTPNKFERYATCKTRPESTKWTASGSKAKMLSVTIHQKRQQTSGGRTLPTASGGQNRQDTKLLQAKREVKPKPPQKVPSVPSGPEKLPHNGRHVKPKTTKAATIPPYRTRSKISPVPPPKLNYTGRYEVQQHGSPKQGSKS